MRPPPPGTPETNGDGTADVVDRLYEMADEAKEILCEPMARQKPLRS